MKFKFLLALAALTLGAVGHADTFPSKPITIVVSSVAGGGLDVLARTMADEMGKRLGQAVVVDNKPGAAGILATQAVARAAPDGHTVLMTFSAPILTVPYMMAKVPYDVRRDLSFITQLCNGQLVMAVNSNAVPARNMKEFVQWAGQNTGKVNYGSFGIGTAPHLLNAYFSHSRKLDMVHAAYKGEAPMVQDLVGGQIQVAIGSLGSLLPHIESGRLRALAVFGDKRLKDLPTLSTMVEQGITDPELQPVGWVVLMGPAGLPPAVLATLEKEARAAALSTLMKARFQLYGMVPMATSSAEFLRDYEATAPRMEQLVRLSGAKAEQ